MAKQRDPKQYAKDIEVVVQDALYNIADSVGDAIAEAMGQVNDVSSATLKDIQGGFRDLSKINKVMADASVKASQGEFSRSKATKIILDRKAKERALESAIEIARRNGLEDTQDLERELAKVKGYNKDIEDSLLAQVKASQNINKAQGISGVALSGLQKLTSKAGLGGLTDVFENAKAASTSLANKLTDGGKKSAGFLGKSRIAAKGMGVALKGVAGYLAGPAGIALLLGKAVKFLLEIDKRTAETAGNLNMSKSESAELNRNIVRASKGMDYFTGRIGEGSKLMGEFANNTGIIATNLEIFNADLGVINRRFGLSAEQTSTMAKNMLVAGQSSTEFATQALGAAEALEMQNGVNLQNQAIMKDIADLTATQFLNLKGQPDLIGRTAAQVRRLGLSFATVEGIMGNLLNFEDSISNELEAELLLGRQLNLEKARAAALNNDYSTVAAEISKEIGSAAEFSKMNRIQQEALAKSVGMSVDDLGKMLKEQVALEKAGFASADAREKEYQRLKAIYGQQKALEMIGMKEFTRQKNNISFQEKLNNLLENMKVIFMDSIAPVLERILENFMKNKNAVNGLVDKVSDFAIKISDTITDLQDGTGTINRWKAGFKLLGNIIYSSLIAPLKMAYHIGESLVYTILAGAAFSKGDITAGKEYWSKAKVAGAAAVKDFTESGPLGTVKAVAEYAKEIGEIDKKEKERSIERAARDANRQAERALKDEGIEKGDKDYSKHKQAILEALKEHQPIVYLDGRKVSEGIALSYTNQ